MSGRTSNLHRVRRAFLAPAVVLIASCGPINAPTQLKIRAVSGDKTVDRVVASGVGPSIIDLPTGCWQLSLSWADQRDTLDLRYTRRAAQQVPPTQRHAR